MAATAVLRLIRNNDIDPSRIGYLGLGTESSTDNSAGAVIVRGMVDRALDALGLPRLSRNCEVHEIKHACLGGVYALKSALRYLNSDGRDRQAIVVGSDLAVYERGSSGEQTQGAGAVAMLCEPEAKLLELDLANAGSSSDYRGPDFRKPHVRAFLAKPEAYAARLRDFPVFNGKYSTYSYVDETLGAFEDMLRKTGLSPLESLSQANSIFFHRPYHNMPVQAASYMLLKAWLSEAPDNPIIEDLCQSAETTREAVLEELAANPDLFGRLLSGNIDVDPLAVTGRVASLIRKSAEFASFRETRMSLGSDLTAHFGNMYSASLLAWMAAGLEDAANQGIDLGDTNALLFGYGSGDAAECIPARIPAGFEAYASRIRLADSMAGALDLTKDQYESLHDDQAIPELGSLPGDRFRISHIGEQDGAAFQDVGVEYYEYIPEISVLRPERARLEEHRV
jgi:hydroxymethylglutaryl-CoA synthase